VPAAVILHGDIEPRSWKVTKKGKDGKPMKDPDGNAIKEKRTRQDWSIKSGYVDTKARPSLYTKEGNFGYVAWHYF